MVLHVDGGPHDTVRCYFTTFSHEFLEFLYEGRRCKDQYVTKSERTSKWENAVSLAVFFAGQDGGTTVPMQL